MSSTARWRCLRCEGRRVLEDADTGKRIPCPECTEPQGPGAAKVHAADAGDGADQFAEAA
ncbi:MAG: hypothetical protein ACREXP_29655 [Steroidobacteraceae bacterium]